MKKSELLKFLAESGSKTDNKTSVKTDTLLESLNFHRSEKDENAELINKVKDISEGNIKTESTWKPAITSTEDITNRILLEAELASRKPNAFRLNIQSMVLDNTHAKFEATRGDKTATVELLFPNANDKISIKLQMEGAEDKLLEVGLEDEVYLENLGEFIISQIDELAVESNEAIQSEVNSTLYGDNVDNSISPNVSVTGTGSPVWESDRRKMNDFMSLFEANFDEEESDDSEDNDESSDLDAFGDLDAKEGDKLGDLGEEGEGDFSESDFSLGGSGGDFGGLGGGDFGGDFGGDDAGDINAEEGGISDEAVDYMTFRDKTDWTQASLDTMQNLTAQSMGKKMQEGKGVVLTSDEILNGSAGLRGSDKPVDVVDKFLKIYPELDNIDLTEEQLTQIEQKLSMNDNQFDAWLQQNLSDFTNEGDVNETLNNEMFDDFKPMGGEEETDTGGEMEFDEFLDSTNIEEPDDSAIEKEAELELGLPPETSEFPNIEGDKESESKSKEEEKK